MLTIVVDTALDVVDADDGVTSLREAVAEASAGERIEFSIAEPVIFLDHPDGELLISRSLSIQGPGADALRLVPVGDDRRALRIDNGEAGADASVEISGLTFAGGDVNGDGGAILNRESLTLTDVVVTQNTAAGNGGGVWSDGPLSVIGGRIDANQAGDSGGGVWSSGEVALSATVIASNTAATDGGGVYASVDATVVETTIDANKASDDGGGLWVSGRLEVERSTISHNEATDNGGGLHSDGPLVAKNATISGNRVVGGFGIGAGLFGRGPIMLVSATVVENAALGLDGSAGGLWNDDDDVTIHNSVVALNGAPLFAPDLRTGSGSLSVTNSLIGDREGAPLERSVTPNPDGAIIGGGAGVGFNPGLGPLQDNGGPTLTHAPLPSSPLLGLGGETELSSDQRGLPYVRGFDADGDGVALVDAGAVERQQDIFFVDTLVDESDGDFSPGDLSLREAVQLANETIADFGDRIAFDPALAGGTILLSPDLGQLAVTDDLTISAADLAERVTIDAGHGPDGVPATGDGSRVLQAIDAELTLESLVISGGDLSGDLADGGGVRSDSPMVIVDTIVEDNATTSDGGGVFSGGPSTLRNVIVRGNSAANGGGVAGGGGFSGIDFPSDADDAERFLRTVAADEVELIDSVVTDNRTSRSGGGVYGLVKLSGSTITENEAGWSGGGVFLESSTAGVTRELYDTTIANNVAGGFGGGLAVAASYFTGGVVTTGLVITDNSAGGSGGGVGGSTDLRDMVFNRATIARNTSAGDGGGINSTGGSVRLTDSVVINNTAGGPSGGGVNAPAVVAERSHFEGNSSTEIGGGIFVDWGGEFRLDQSSVVGNSSGVYVRGVHRNVPAEVIDSTIAGNGGHGVVVWGYPDFPGTLSVIGSTIAAEDGFVLFSAGAWGIDFDVRESTIVGEYYFHDGAITARNSLLAVEGSPTFPIGGRPGAPSYEFVLENTLLTNNVRTDLAEAPIGQPDARGNLIGGATFGVIDPLLAPLGDYGGRTPTLALLPGSPAIDAGAPSPSGVGEFDQRGEPFARVIDGDGDGQARRDMGAFEFRQEGFSDVPGLSVVPGLLGDYNGDGVVNAADYTAWRDSLGGSVPIAFTGADGDGDLAVTEDDLDVWRNSFGMAATIPNTGFSPSVDGAVDAGWLSVAPRAVDNNVFGASDASAVWRAVWDEAHLYVLIEVTDDTVVSDTLAPYEDDGVEIYVDPNFSRGSAYDGVDDSQYLVEFNASAPILSPRSPEGLLTGVTASQATTDDGYRVEFAAPWSTLGVVPGDGLALGLEIAFLDDDDGGSVDGKLQWHSDVNRSFLEPSRFAPVLLKDTRGQAPPTDASVSSDDRVYRDFFATSPLAFDVTKSGVEGPALGAREQSASERRRLAALLLARDEAFGESSPDADAPEWTDSSDDIEEVDREDDAEAPSGLGGRRS